MDNDDFIPPVFFRIAIFVFGLYVLIAGIASLYQSFTNAFSIFAQHLATNLNRLGLIFELIGLLSLLPDLMERRKLSILERRLNTIGVPISIGRIIEYLFKYLSLMSTSDTQGLLGFVSQVSRLLGVLVYSVMTVTFLADPFKFQNIGLLFLGLLLIGYTWLLLELVNLRVHSNQDNMDRRGLKFLRMAAFWACGALIFFLPLVFLSLGVISILNWISKNPLNKIIATITFPFILLGTIFQLVASFL